MFITFISPWGIVPFLSRYHSCCKFSLSPLISPLLPSTRDASQVLFLTTAFSCYALRLNFCSYMSNEPYMQLYLNLLLECRRLPKFLTTITSFPVNFPIWMSHRPLKLKISEACLSPFSINYLLYGYSCLISWHQHLPSNSNQNLRSWKIVSTVFMGSK